MLPEPAPAKPDLDSVLPDLEPDPDLIMVEPIVH